MTLLDQNRTETPGEWGHEAVRAPTHGASSESIAAASRPSRRRLAIWGGNVFLLGLVATAAVGLTVLGGHVSRQPHSIESAEPGGAGIIIRLELLDFWLPPLLSELAQRQFESQPIRSHEDVRRFLKLHRQQDSWYAVTTRGHQANGDFADLTIIRRPFDDRAHFPELMDILAVAARDGRIDRAGDSAAATVHVMPADLLTLEPRQAVAELLGQRRRETDQKRFR
jgi:hypothetical protein